VARSLQELLAEAVRLARENAEAGQGPFGALVVRGDEIIGTGVNTTLEDGDPTAHAEVQAIRDAGAVDLAGATVVASCEPCPMCQATAALVGVSRIVYAAPKEVAAQAGFELRPVAAEMQALLRSLATLPVEHVETPGAEEPFARFRPAAVESRGRNPVRELRVALTVEDYGQTVAFYRDVLGLLVRMAWDEPEGRGTIFEAGRATLEVISVDQAELIDRIEVGERVAGPVRLALEVEDSERTARELVAGGAESLAAAVVTPWGDRNARVSAPDGMQLTLFTSVGD
jgi:tRNA(Arg) A34 adenosine deaminase TadA/catechol 2,3-dioxygenase-like lactoylglutathione lyase family enzyme